jgi:anti-sigma-K factor RskA
LNSNEIISSGLLELYVLGQTNAEETMQVSQWINQYPEVALEVEQIEATLIELDQLNGIPVVDDVKKNIWNNIDFDQKENESKVVSINNATTNKKFNYKLAAAAAVALLLSLGAFTAYNFSKLKSVNQDLATTKNELNKAKSEVEALKNKIAVPLNDYSQQVVLKGTKASPNSTAKLFYIKNTNEVYIEPSGLPTAPTGFQYQLWAIVDGKPVDAGMIQHNGEKYNLQKMKSFGKVEAFAITLEKQGGSATPTLEQMYVMSII